MTPAARPRRQPDYSVGFAFRFGRPPFAPLAREDAALASERARPPLRPSDTAAGSLSRSGVLRLATGGQNVERFHAAHGRGVVAMRLEHERSDASEHVGQLACGVQRDVDGAFGLRGGAVDVHAQRISEPLWFVNRAKQARKRVVAA